ncbi:MAG TPA: Holliday junction resolvase RuvX [Candidatus Acidoferrum sp.]|jgi:putative Holliday junction resolvase|nr:Holliday junction resolvase RuvX [Candidatus Acidoferrum sp.]
MIGKKARAADSSNLGVLRATRYTSKVTQLLSSKNQAKPATILALDYGRARIGLAIADAQARLAKPLATLERINRNEDMRRLRELAREQGVTQIIVGLPLRLDGSHGEMAEEALRFAERVRKQIGVPVEMVDERLTSWEAQRLLEEQGGRTMNAPVRMASGKDLDRPKRKPKTDGKLTVDALAAAVILNEYLQRSFSDL